MFNYRCSQYHPARAWAYWACMRDTCRLLAVTYIPHLALRFFSRFSCTSRISISLGMLKCVPLHALWIESIAHISICPFCSRKSLLTPFSRDVCTRISLVSCVKYTSAVFTFPYANNNKKKNIEGLINQDGKLCSCIKGAHLETVRIIT